jgi:HEAT repeat protein
MYKRIIHTALSLVLAFAFCARALGQAQAVPFRETEGSLIAILKSDASVEQKASACRQLATTGGKDAVAPLAALLADEKLSHMARYALETIPDPAVDDALRDALGKLSGRPLVGVIGSIGVRRDAKAVEALAARLHDNDADVAQAAARALGRIATPPAAKALDGALVDASAANQLAVCEGLFRCAESFQAGGHRDQAIAIYDRLRIMSLPHQARAGAVRGAILARRDQGLPLIREYLQHSDYHLFAAAVATSIGVRGKDVTIALASELSRLSADRQVLVIGALGKRRDVVGLPSLITLTRAGEKPVRLAAIRAAAEIGDVSAAPIFVELMADADREIAKLASESVASLRGKEIDAAVLAMLDSGQPQRRLAALELIGRRRMTACVPNLLKASGDADGQVRLTAIRQLGELAGMAELPALLELLMRSNGQDLEAAEQAVASVCQKSEQPEACEAKLVALISQAQPPKKIALLRVLGMIGGAESLKAVRAAAKDPGAETELRAAAIRVLGAWKTSDAAGDLLAAAKSATSETEKLLALRGYLGIASRSDLPADQRLAMCKQASSLVQRVEEKRMLLAALAAVPSGDSLALVTPYLDDAASKEEACTTAVGIAEELLKRKISAKGAQLVVESMKKASRVTGDSNLANRAKALLEKARNSRP